MQVLILKERRSLSPASCLAEVLLQVLRRATPPI